MSLNNQISEAQTICNYNPIDRRESPRCDTQFHVMFPDGHSENKSGNIGLGGCYFTTNHAINAGEAIRVNLDPDRRRNLLDVNGRVIRLTFADGKIGVAAKFDELPFGIERAIARWLDYQ